jgi:hypothetical protein
MLGSGTRRKGSRMITITEILDECWNLYFAAIRSALLILTSGAHLALMVALAFVQRTLSVCARAKVCVEGWTPTTPNIFVLRERSQIAVLECRHAEGSTQDRKDEHLSNREADESVEEDVGSHGCSGRSFDPARRRYVIGSRKG